MFKYWGYALNIMQYYKKKATFARNITKIITKKNNNNNKQQKQVTQ